MMLWMCCQWFWNFQMSQLILMNMINDTLAFFLSESEWIIILMRNGYGDRIRTHATYPQHQICRPTVSRTDNKFRETGSAAEKPRLSVDEEIKKNVVLSAVENRYIKVWVINITSENRLFRRLLWWCKIPSI